MYKAYAERKKEACSAPWRSRHVKMIKNDGFKHIYPPTMAFRHVLRLYTCAGLCEGWGACVPNPPVTTSANLQIAAWTHDCSAVWQHGNMDRRRLMCLHHGIFIYVQIVCRLNGHISKPPSVLHNRRTDRHQRGSVPQRGSWCCVEHQQTPACCLCVWRGNRGRGPSCKRHHYCRHHSGLLMGGTLYTRHAVNVSSYFLSYSPEMEYLLMAEEKKAASVQCRTSHFQFHASHKWWLAFCLCGPFLVQSSFEVVGCLSENVRFDNH